LRALLDLKNKIQPATLPLSENPEGGLKKAKSAKVAHPKAKVNACSPLPATSKRQAICDYLEAHPGSKTIEIAEALGFARTAVVWNLRQMLGEYVICVGKTSKSRWSLVNVLFKAGNIITDKKQAPPIVDHTESDESEKLECKLCHAPCASTERLQRHMLSVHEKVI
jgi:hypothetical protein